MQSRGDPGCTFSKLVPCVRRRARARREGRERRRCSERAKKAGCGRCFLALTYRMPGMRPWFLSAMNVKHTICSIFAPEQKPHIHRSTPHATALNGRPGPAALYWWRWRKHSVFCGLFCTKYNSPIQHRERERKR